MARGAVRVLRPTFAKVNLRRRQAGSRNATEDDEGSTAVSLSGGDDYRARVKVKWLGLAMASEVTS